MACQERPRLHRGVDYDSFRICQERAVQELLACSLCWDIHTEEAAINVSAVETGKHPGNLPRRRRKADGKVLQRLQRNSVQLREALRSQWASCRSNGLQSCFFSVCGSARRSCRSSGTHSGTRTRKVAVQKEAAVAMVAGGCSPWSWSLGSPAPSS